jgi:hypothetical protein
MAARGCGCKPPVIIRVYPCNDVTDAAFLDELSGNAALNGVPVTLTAVHS